MFFYLIYDIFIFILELEILIKHDLIEKRFVKSFDLW